MGSLKEPKTGNPLKEPRPPATSEAEAVRQVLDCWRDWSPGFFLLADPIHLDPKRQGRTYSLQPQSPRPPLACPSCESEAGPFQKELL